MSSQVSLTGEGPPTTGHRVCRAQALRPGVSAPGPVRAGVRRWASGWAQVGLEEKGPVQDAHLSRVTSRRRRLGPSPHGSFPRLREEPAGAISTVGVGGSLGTVSRAWVQRFELSQTPGPAWGHSARRCLTALSSDGRRFWRRGRAGLPPR